MAKLSGEGTNFGSEGIIEEYNLAIASLEEALAAHRQTKQDYDLNSNDSYETGVYDLEERKLMVAIAMAKKERDSIVIITEDNKDKAVIHFEDIVQVQIKQGDNDPKIEKFILTGGLPNIAESKISINSPLGKAIYGKKVGDTASYSVGKNTFYVTILTKECASEKTQNQPGCGE